MMRTKKNRLLRRFEAWSTQGEMIKAVGAEVDKANEDTQVVTEEIRKSVTIYVFDVNQHQDAMELHHRTLSL